MTTQRPHVVVTGTATGIGRATVLHLIDRGYAVFAAVRKPEDAEAWEQTHPEYVVPLVLDVTKHETIEGAVDWVTDRLAGAPLRGLVNNAGIVGAVGSIAEALNCGFVRFSVGVLTVCDMSVADIS